MIKGTKSSTGLSKQIQVNCEHGVQHSGANQAQGPGPEARFIVGLGSRPGVWTQCLDSGSRPGSHLNVIPMCQEWGQVWFIVRTRDGVVGQKASYWISGSQ